MGNNHIIIYKSNEIKKNNDCLSCCINSFWQRKPERVDDEEYAKVVK